MQRLWLLGLLASLFLAMATLAGTVVQGPGNLEEEGSDPEQPVAAAVQPTHDKTPGPPKPGQYSPLGGGDPEESFPVPTAVRKPHHKWMKPPKPGMYSPMGDANHGPPQ